MTRRHHAPSTAARAVCATALVLAVWPTAPAVAGYTVSDPDCVARYGNSFAVYEFTVRTGGPHQYEPSSVTSGGLACGTVLRPGKTYYTAGSPTQFTRADISEAPDVEVYPTADIEEGSYVGRADFSVLTFFFIGPGTPIFLSDQEAELTVLSRSDKHCPASAVACYVGTASSPDPMLGPWHNHYSVAYDSQTGRYVLTVGEIELDPDLPAWRRRPAGFTRFSLDLCAYAGSPGGEKCGGEDRPPLQTNGTATEYPDMCAKQSYSKDGYGMYEVTAVNRAGLVTQPDPEYRHGYACMPWVGVK